MNEYSDARFQILRAQILQMQLEYLSHFRSFYHLKSNFLADLCENFPLVVLPFRQIENKLFSVEIHVQLDFKLQKISHKIAIT